MSTTEMDNFPLDNLGKRIRELRRGRGLTLSDLSATAQVSIAMLSHIERGHASPSLNTLERLRVVFGIRLADFFERTDPAGEDISFVVRQNSRSTLPFGSFGLTKELLSPEGHSNLEMLMLILEPGGSSGMEPWVRNGEKAGYVLEGQLQLTVGSRSEVLEQGDSFRFDSSIEHAFRNTADRITRVIWIIKSDVFG